LRVQKSAQPVKKRACICRNIGQIVVAALVDEVGLAHDGQTEARDVGHSEIRCDRGMFDPISADCARVCECRQRENDLEFRRAMNRDRSAALMSTAHEMRRILEQRQIFFMKVQLGRSHLHAVRVEEFRQLDSAGKQHALRECLARGLPDEVTTHPLVISRRHFGQAGYTSLRQQGANLRERRRLAAQRLLQPDIFIEQTTGMAVTVALEPSRRRAMSQ